MKKITQFALFIGATLGVCSAQAGGYQLNDYSVTGLGRSYAGAGVVGDDYSAIAFNPAGMTLMKHSGVQLSGSFINLKADVDSLNSDKHKKMNFWQPIPTGFAQYNVNDRFSIGMGVYAPFGLKTEYDSNWYGNQDAILSKLEIIDFNVSAAYKLTDKWSVGASAIMRYIYGHLTNKAPLPGGEIDIEVDGWTKTGALGIMYEPTKNTRFGLSYRLRSTQQVKGDFTVSGLSGPYAPFNETAIGRASPALPETLTFSAYHRYKKFGFSGTARWTHWSQSFPELVVKTNAKAIPALTGGTEVRTIYNYDNAWTLTGGVDYYYCKNLTFRFGGGWDESPAHNNSNRTIRIPDNDRIWLSVGASYMKNNWQLDVGYAHMMGRTAKALNNTNKVKFKNMQSHILGIQVQYKF